DAGRPVDDPQGPEDEGRPGALRGADRPGGSVQRGRPDHGALRVREEVQRGRDGPAVPVAEAPRADDRGDGGGEVKKPMVFGDPSSHGARYAAKYGWEKYAKEYEAGWRAASRPESAKWDSGASSDAWDDGYLDRAALRDK